jgi:HK97 family phage prohead protease
MDRIYCPFEIKNQRDDDGTFSGYGSTFGNVDSYGDTVAKGAFKKTIADAKSGAAPWPAFLMQHGADQNPIGILTDLSEDDNGLKLKGRLAIKTRRGLEAYNLLRMTPRPAFNGLSIGYRAKDFELHKSGPAKRTLKQVDLVEVSLVTFPADRFARVARVKSWLDAEPVDEAITMKDFAMIQFQELRRLTNHVPR